MTGFELSNDRLVGLLALRPFWLDLLDALPGSREERFRG